MTYPNRCSYVSIDFLYLYNTSFKICNTKVFHVKCLPGRTFSIRSSWIRFENWHLSRYWYKTPVWINHREYVPWVRGRNIWRYGGKLGPASLAMDLFAVATSGQEPTTTWGDGLHFKYLWGHSGLVGGGSRGWCKCATGQLWKEILEWGNSILIHICKKQILVICCALWHKRWAWRVDLAMDILTHLALHRSSQCHSDSYILSLSHSQIWMPALLSLPAHLLKMILT